MHGGDTRLVLHSAEGRGCQQQMQSTTTCCAVLGLRRDCIITQPAAASTLQMLTSAMVQGTDVEATSHHVRQ